MIVSKTKEIGIRKILGANMLGISGLLTKEFIVLVLLANIISLPLSWYFAAEWLKGFAYQIELSPMLFIFTTLITMVITVLAVSIQTIKAAMTDPVKSLKYE
jgi:putative ABC transport system permease protein